MYIEFQEICTQVSRKYSDDCIYRVGTISDTRTTTIENDKYYSMILTINILNFVHNNVWLNLKTKNDILYIFKKKIMRENKILCFSSTHWCIKRDHFFEKMCTNRNRNRLNSIFGLYFENKKNSLSQKNKMRSVNNFLLFSV